jgi:hypothetical protein
MTSTGLRRWPPHSNLLSRLRPLFDELLVCSVRVSMAMDTRPPRPRRIQSILVCCRTLRYLLVLALFSVQVGRSFATEPLLPPDRPPGTGIQRTMRLLATSTFEHPHNVFILFYGQSISKQPWWLTVARDLRRRFPSANLRIENRSIGGFASPLLVKTAQFDLYAADPDLIIFQDYGDEPDYLRIIREIRTQTKAEVALQTDHLTSWGLQPREEKSFRWTEWHNDVWLPAIARKYGCGLIPIRAAWKNFLTDNKLAPHDLLVDDIHLNTRGMRVMGALVEQYLQYNPALPPPYEPVSVTFLPNPGRKFDLRFAGNRVDAIASEASRSPVHFLIDGQRPSTFPDLPVISRPNDIPGQDWPWETGGLLSVGHRKPLVPEAWTIKIDSVGGRGQVAQFEVSGSVTGFDGRGSTDCPFVSTSGRVILAPEDWWIHGVDHHFLLRPGQLIRWQVFPMSADQWSPPKAGSTITIASGLPNTDHVLSLRTIGPRLPIQELIVERPPVTNLDLFEFYLRPPYAWQRISWMYLTPGFERHDLLWLCLMLLGACTLSIGIYPAIRRTARSSS